MSLDVKNSVPMSDEIKGYLPQCCVLISKYPYFYTMKECLSCMVEHINQDVQEMFTFVKDYTHLLTMAPVPPAGNVAIRLNLFHLKIDLYPADCPEKPVVDIPLHLVFLSFSIDDVLTIFTAIVTEQRIVFLSSAYSLLTIIMESFLHFIQPFKWRYTYVPIICQTHLDLLEAPGTFMMGCHERHSELVKQICGLVVVNIDNGTVSVNEETLPNFEIVTKSIPKFPSEPALLFKKVCKKIKFQTELTDVQRPFSYNPESEREYRMKKRQQFNTEITFAFLELMVNLFRGVLSELRIDHQLFNQDDFMRSVPEESKEFYKQVFQTDMFKTFIQDRLNDKSDFWSDFEAKTRQYARRVSNQEPSNSAPVRTQKRKLKKQVSVSVWPSSLLQREFQIFKLPTLNDSAQYISMCVQLLTKALQECRDLEPRASYLYLRGMFLAADGKLSEALEDLYSLSSTNARLLATESVQKLFKLIPREHHAAVRSRCRSFNLEVMRQTSQDNNHLASTRLRTDSVSFQVKMPETDLSKEDFVTMVSVHCMADDYDTICRLFNSLIKLDGDMFVDKQTFESFVLCYKENQHLCQNINISHGKLQDQEFILCLSQLIKTDFGTGRIGLTDKRLFFLKDVSNAFKEIIKLRDIAHIEMLQSRTILNKGDILVIKNEDGSIKFTASLKEERNCWYMLIEEMRSGKIVAEAMKDISAIHEAMLNVLLVKAVIRIKEDLALPPESIRSVANNLCYFTDYVKNDRHRLPLSTIQALQHRIDPNFGEHQKHTVEYLLYVPGCNTDHDNSRPPRLWCCMSDGKIKAFDATNWELETSVIHTKKAVTCMVAVGNKQLWAGSYGIFIIDTETMTCNKTLTEHRDLVTGIQLSKDGRYAYSASIDAVIIKWEIQTLKSVEQIHLENVKCLRSLKLRDDKLWCGTWQDIVVIDFHGNQKQLFPFKYEPREQSKISQMSCFEITDNEVWAGCRREGLLLVWERNTAQLKSTIQLDCMGISTMLLSEKKLWIGTKGNQVGLIYIYNTDTHEQFKQLQAHDDSVRSLCCAELRYVMSGAGSKDGKIAVWTPKTLEDSDKFSEPSAGIV
ncbi:DENN domain-containing protein 3-like isoform X2 [Gigantopelta aegis]|nr:DENN domain-containing protein 3-like isoform X2 [Gigantopelta aegis]